MSSTREKLQRALSEQRLVRIDRTPQFAETEVGFVVAIGARWLLIARVVDGGHLDGYLAMRLRDITRVYRDRSFASRVARSLPSWPPTAPADVMLDSTESLITSVGAGQRLFGIEKQHERRAMWIGQLEDLDAKHVWLHELDLQAEWSRQPIGYRRRAVTSVTFGDRYLGALALVAGQPLTAEPVA
jgi:hypothetical protein